MVVRNMVNRVRNKRPAPDSTAHTVIHRCLCCDKRFSYYLQQPDSPSADRMLVLLHGISRNAEDLLTAFAPLAQAAGYVVVAPLFSREVCRDFQRLGRHGKGPRADWILEAVLDEVGAQVGAVFSRFDMFGFSAGAQLAHRYAMVHPHRVRAMALGSAGWYTMPNHDRYPYGLRLSGELPDVAFLPPRFLRVPARVYVGDEDIERDKALNRHHRVEKKQGPHRVARAKSWMKAMNRRARKLGLSQPVSLELMPGVSHDFCEAVEKYQLPQKVMAWLLSGRQVVENSVNQSGHDL